MVKINRDIIVFVALCGLLMVAVAAAAEPATNKPAAKQAKPLEDAPITEDQAALLDLAMDAVSKMPLDPHIKNRSRGQYEVAQAALAMDQPRRALAYMNRIDNWRRGLVAAEYALYAAQRGHIDNLEHYLRIARASAKLASQDWRRELIHVKIAQTHWVLGNHEAVDRFNQQLQTDAYRGRIAEVQAREARTDLQTFERLTARLDKLIERQDYDVIINSAEAYAELYRSNYQDETRRGMIERKLRTAYRKMPGPETIDMLLLLAEVALKKDDTAQAMTFVDEADAVEAQVPWTPHREYEYEYLARLAKMRCRVGDVDGARTAVDAASKRLDETIEKIFNIWRADCLRPLAEAYQVMGDKDQAAAHYARAIELGMLNPNGRPRAEDLSRTALSMARLGFTPNEKLWSRLRHAQDQLRAPW